MSEPTELNLDALYLDEGSTLVLGKGTGRVMSQSLMRQLIALTTTSHTDGRNLPVVILDAASIRLL